MKKMNEQRFLSEKYSFNIYSQIFLYRRILEIFFIFYSGLNRKSVKCKRGGN